MLVKSLAGLAVALIDTKVSPTAAMSEWLITQEPPAGWRDVLVEQGTQASMRARYGLTTEGIQAAAEALVKVRRLEPRLEADDLFSRERGRQRDRWAPLCRQSAPVRARRCLA